MGRDDARSGIHTPRHATDQSQRAVDGESATKETVTLRTERRRLIYVNDGLVRGVIGVDDYHRAALIFNDRAKNPAKNIHFLRSSVCVEER